MPNVGYAHRIRRLREHSGQSPEEVAAASEIGLPCYYDVESYDDETTYGLTLRQLYQLATALRVNLRQLVASSGDFTIAQPERFNLSSLAAMLRSRVEADGLAAVEHSVGWRLEHFLADPSEAWDEPLDFLRFVCECLGINWMDVVPAEGPANRK